MTHRKGINHRRTEFQVKDGRLLDSDCHGGLPDNQAIAAAA
ncbi:MAG: hypothetical protein AAGE59_25375 [Cyanobacteria bacterium P01_F01_bin.86]